MTGMVLSEFKLGANAIGSRDQERFLQACRKAHQAAKTSESAYDLWSVSCLYALADSVDEGAPRLHIDPSGFVVHSRMLYFNDPPLSWLMVCLIRDWLRGR
jgi:hypothetical protein